MSEQLRRVTTAGGLSSLACVGFMAAVDFSRAFGPAWRGLAVLGALFAVCSLVVFRLLLRWEGTARRNALHVKLIGERGERLDALLAEYNACFVSRLSLERCGLQSVPRRVVECFSSISSLNLRGNQLVSLDGASCVFPFPPLFSFLLFQGLCGLTTLRMLNVSKVFSLPPTFSLSLSLVFADGAGRTC